MGRRRKISESSKTLNSSADDALADENKRPEGKGFYACYLLVSLNPRYKGHTYIGFTVNPRRRIRQHNGEIGCGACRTKRRRPWEMALCICGFPTNVSALQFEWAWQHPVESLAVRKAAASFKSLSGIANKIKLAYTMLNLPSWQSMNITVNFFSTKYMKHAAGCPSLPEHMKIQICSMDELMCYTKRVDGLSENEEDCMDEEEFNNNPSNSDSSTDTLDNSAAHDSTENKNPGDKSTETYEWSKESDAREPCHTFASQDQRQPIGSIKSLTTKLSPISSSEREEMISEEDFMCFMNDSCINLCQPAYKQSCTKSAADINKESSSVPAMPHEAEIIDLSTPSPSCRTFTETEKRRVPSVCSDFIDLTKSPNFIQL
ncbi:hypothetical protein L6164_030734 [Bauhinia variegata]|uniref:Uncharacterized protein n=1 Tax=Bauhinia variegata TaxID=167791 RepID=A0ACB9LDB2_BAUVA|nr:hypothetical protein L6164_030734 [Bauhinia variegata]